MITRDKVRGFFLGTAAGDSLGMPVEGWSAEKIKEKYGRITEYQDPSGHKYHSGLRAGSVTDDTILTLVVAKSLIEANGFDMDSQAAHHVQSYKQHTGGWGRTTKEAVEKLANGVHWKESGVANTDADEYKNTRGMGNGVAMKVGPIGLWMAAKPVVFDSIAEKVVDFCGMTHRTSIAVSSALSHMSAVSYCLMSSSTGDRLIRPAFRDLPSPIDFINFQESFVGTIISACRHGKLYFPDTLGDDMSERMNVLSNVNEAWTPEQIIKEFGGGSYYVYNSLPFTYAFFVRDPNSIDSLYDCISNGGDCDTNGSLIGGLLGALHGTSIFPKHLIDGLLAKDEIIKTADCFSDKFGIMA